MVNKLRNDIHKFIIDWNQKFPIDYWWRTRYSIPFGSEKHRNTTFIDMFIDYEEDRLMNNIYKDNLSEDESLVGNSMAQQDIDDAFDNIDLSNYNNSKEDS